MTMTKLKEPLKIENNTPLADKQTLLTDLTNHFHKIKDKGRPKDHAKSNVLAAAINFQDVVVRQLQDATTEGKKELLKEYEILNDTIAKNPLYTKNSRLKGIGNTEGLINRLKATDSYITAATDYIKITATVSPSVSSTGFFKDPAQKLQKDILAEQKSFVFNPKDKKSVAKAELLGSAQAYMDACKASSQDSPREKLDLMRSDLEKKLEGYKESLPKWQLKSDIAKLATKLLKHYEHRAFEVESKNTPK